MLAIRFPLLFIDFVCHGKKEYANAKSELGGNNYKSCFWCIFQSQFTVRYQKSSERYVKTL